AAAVPWFSTKSAFSRETPGCPTVLSSPTNADMATTASVMSSRDCEDTAGPAFPALTAAATLAAAFEEAPRPAGALAAAAPRVLARRLLRPRLDDTADDAAATEAATSPRVL
ncbi:unnamed protein product, partial [Ectocarpus sp. 12 AP-2014]